MPTANDVMAIARKQIGYKESPANSNRTKYGRKFGRNGEAWCFIFEWWCGMRAAEKYGGSNPFPHNANAAYGQDDIVNKMGGVWVLKKNKSRDARKKALKRYRKGDCVDFDFGIFDAYRRHTGLVDEVDGDYVWCIEGNTTPDGKNGSQSNGGQVCRKKRHYSMICSAARPKYTKDKNKLIADKAHELAWPKGTPKAKYKYPEGKATKEFSRAIEKVYPHRDSWSVQPRKGASCDTAVGTVVRASGVDKHFPRGLDEQVSYLKNSKKWKRVRRKNSKDGDVIVQIYNSGAGHIMIDMGKNVANAHYIKKTYMVIESKKKILKSAKECKLYRVYRPR